MLRGGMLVLFAALVLGVLVPGAASAGGRAIGGGGGVVTAPDPGTGFVLPLPPPPVVLTAFDAPAHRFGPGHRGVDLGAPVGSVVRAAGPGRVVYAALLAGRGVVSVEHAGGLRTTYEPVTAAVVVGARVAAGDPLGTLDPGHPTCAPADCLHWGARLPDRTYLDPLTLITGWPVRLWPWDDP